MKIEVHGAIVELVEGDITEQDTDAVVNAANRSLLGGGGVDGAIHHAGGAEILAECRKLGGCDTGDAKITTGGRLRARYVIHAVGPVYSPAAREYSAELLASAYRRSLEVATAHDVASVAFPAISTGAYRYPMDEAAAIALHAVVDYLKSHEAHGIDLVRFCLYGPCAFAAFRRAIQDLEQSL